MGKTDNELAAAVERGILAVNCESMEEIEVLSGLALARGRQQACCLRINPDVEADTHAYLTTGTAESKFGIPATQFQDAARHAARHKGVHLVGLDFHLGSQIMSPEPYARALLQVRSMLEDLRRGGFDLQLLDIGGGLAAKYGDEMPATAEQFKEGIAHLVRDLGLTLVLEPGRFILANAGVLVCRVLFVKRSEGRRFAITDAGMNDLIRPALYSAVHRIEALQPRSGEAEQTEVAGPICESGDFLGHGRNLPPLQRGDLLAVFSAGAYGMSMASNYNLRPRAAEVLVDGDSFRLIRRRENQEDLLRCEQEIDG